MHTCIECQRPDSAKYLVCDDCYTKVDVVVIESEDITDHQAKRYIAAKHELFGAMTGCEFTLIDGAKNGHKGTLQYDYGGRMVSVIYEDKHITIKMECYLEHIVGFKVHQDKFALTAWVR